MPLRFDLQPMNREMVPMSEILVSDERENGWVTERGTIQISCSISLSQHRVITHLVGRIILEKDPGRKETSPE